MEANSQAKVNKACKGDFQPEAQKGIRKYNAGEYYKAHEHLELAWRDTKTAERDLYQGVLQVGVAYYQAQRGNYRGALKMFKRAQGLLRFLPKVCRGVDVGQLLLDAKEIENTLRELGPEGISGVNPDLFPPVPIVGP